MKNIKNLIISEVEPNREEAWIKKEDGVYNIYIYGDSGWEPIDNHSISQELIDLTEEVSNLKASLNALSIRVSALESASANPGV